MGNDFKILGNNNWYFENVSEYNWFSAFKINKSLHEQKTKFQEMKILDLGIVGKALTLDGYIQSCENDEKLYHEMLVHPAMLLHENPKKVFIGGGGEGATAREVLKHKGVEECVMVDIDGDCVEFCKKYLPKHNKGVYEDKRMKLVIDDAKKYLEESKDGEFDVMIMDLADPTEGGPCYQLYTQEFYEMCMKKLSKNGILVTQATSADFFCIKQVYAPIFSTIRSVFKKTVPYHIHIPSFVGSWGFVLATKTDADTSGKNVDEKIEKRISGGSNSLKVYDEECHVHTFSNPKWFRNTLNSEKRIMQKDNFQFFS